jgi:hypothetical protein
MNTAPKKPTLSPVANGTTALLQKAKLTKWTANQPVTKRLSLAADGSVHKASTAAQLYEGSITRLECEPAEFIKVLQGVGANDCLSYGLPINTSATQVTTRGKFEAAGRPAHLMARLATAMAWSTGPGIMMVDYDPEESVLTPAELRDALYTCCAPLRDAAHVWAASTSSCLTNAKTRQEVRGIRGQRVYTFVDDATDIPRAADVLAKRAWLNGHGYIKVSKAGSMLERNIIDTAVFQTNRIDYCAPSICESPLKQTKPKPELHGNPKMALDTKVALPNLTAEQQKQYEQLVQAAKAAKAPEAKVIRDQYIQTRADEYVAKGMDKDSAVRMITQLLEGQVLSADFVLTSEDGIEVTVAELLRNKAQWNGKNFHDPIEPDYHGDDRIARAYLTGPGRPLIRSFAHGGCTYFLSHTTETIQLNPGERHPYQQKMATVLRERGEFYVRANGLVSVDADNKFVNHNALTVLSVFDRSFRFETFAKKDKKWLPVDPPKDLAQLFHAAFVSEFSPIKSIITAPIMCPLTQRLITSSGYDAETCLFAAMPDDICPVTEQPSLADLADGLALLWRSVSLFPFVDPIDETIMLTAMLTAVMRPLLPTAPGIAFDAPVQGSGKSLLTMVLCALSGVKPAMTPWPGARGEPEIDKTIFTKLLEGCPVVAFDNVTGEVDSPSLASVFTTETVSGRIMQTHKTGTAPTNVLILLNGNNIKFKGELPRRILKCRIDPRSEKPHQRIFDFDPVTLVQATRQAMTAAALTLIKGYFAAALATRPGEGRTASFNEWDDTIRQTMCWLADLQKAGQLPQGTLPDGRIFPRLVDPFIAIDDAIEDDPTLLQLSRFMSAWAAQVGTGFSARMTVKELVQKHGFDTTTFDPASQLKSDPDNPPLHEVLQEIAGHPTTNIINTKKLGTYLSGFKARPIDGLRLCEGERRQRALTWWVEDVGELRESGESVSTATNKKSNVSKLKADKSDSQNSPNSPAARTAKRALLKLA